MVGMLGYVTYVIDKLPGYVYATITYKHFLLA